MQTNKTQPNLIVELSFQFALKVIAYVELLETKHKYVIARQLLKSGISIGANVREAQNGESKLDFLKIAAKEAGETEYWLQLCKHSNNYGDCTGLIEDCLSISKVLSKIIASTKLRHQ